MKTCSKCGQAKPATSTHFSKHPHTKDRLQSWCRVCTSNARHKSKKLCSLCDYPTFRQGFCSSHFHRLKRYGDPLAGGRSRMHHVSKEDRREFVRSYLLEHGCADCGYDTDARALSFDHRPGTVKIRDIKSGMQFGWQALLDEIAKCDVVCMNCHTIRTSERRKEVMPVSIPKKTLTRSARS